MRASEALKLAAGRTYADHALENVLKYVKAAAIRGHTSTAYYFEGPTAVSQDEYDKLVRLVENLGYRVQTHGRVVLLISWATLKDKSDE